MAAREEGESPIEDRHSGFYGWLEGVFEPMDNWLGPDRAKHKPACLEDKEIFLDCVMKSDCYVETNNFLHCVQDGISKECKALRYNYYMCKRSQIFWHKSFSTDDPRRI